VYASAEELLAGMPRERYPRSGPDAAPERKAANAWLRDNVVGKTVEWSGVIEGLGGIGPAVTLTEAKGDRYRADISLNWTRKAHALGTGGWEPSLGRVRLGEMSAFTVISHDTPPPFGAPFGEPEPIEIDAWRGLTVPAVDDGLARHLRDLKGKVTVRATIVGAEFEDKRSCEVESARHPVPVSGEAEFILWLRARVTSIDGLSLPQEK